MNRSAAWKTMTSSFRWSPCSFWMASSLAFSSTSLSLPAAGEAVHGRRQRGLLRFRCVEPLQQRHHGDGGLLLYSVRRLAAVAVCTPPWRRGQPWGGASKLSVLCTVHFFYVGILPFEIILFMFSWKMEKCIQWNVSPVFLDNGKGVSHVFMFFT